MQCLVPIDTKAKPAAGFIQAAGFKKKLIVF